MGLEGIICKQADAPYRAGRGHGWVKVKCHGREEFIVLGWTPPGGSRTGLGSLHLGYYDPQGRPALCRRCRFRLLRATNWTELSERLAGLASDPPKPLLVAGDPLPRTSTG